MSFAELEALIPRRDTELSLVWTQQTVCRYLSKQSQGFINSIFRDVWTNINAPRVWRFVHGWCQESPATTDSSTVKIRQIRMPAGSIKQTKTLQERGWLLLGGLQFHFLPVEGVISQLVDYPLGRWSRCVASSASVEEEIRIQGGILINCVMQIFQREQMISSSFPVLCQ